MQYRVDTAVILCRCVACCIFRQVFFQTKYLTKLLVLLVMHVLSGALNLQEMKFARNGGGNCKERKCKERPQNWHPCEFARNGICKEINN